MSGEVVVINPYQPYALMLIESLWRNHEIRTICLHTDRRQRLLLEGRHPVLRSKAISAHYMITHFDNTAESASEVAKQLRATHDIVGVLPYEEGLVEPMAALAEHLGLSWAQPDVIPHFRDKLALKQLVRRNDPTIRLNRFRLVTDADEVLQIVRTEDISDFVLKPNSGSGNRCVGFFTSDTSRADISRHLSKIPGGVLLEEFISGTEYWVNGQMDADGRPTVVGIGQYYRIEHNGVRNLEVGSYSVSPDDPAFIAAKDYAERVMRATGLRRSPFHLELIIDREGACLVEVGARFCGELGALLDMAHHGPQLDLIDVAAHYYVSEADIGPLPLDWHRVVQSWVATAIGDSPHDQRLVEVRGVDEVEGSSNFLFWIKEPQPGDHVHRTTSLTTRAWSVGLRGARNEDPEAVINRARAIIQLRGTADDDMPVAEKWPMYRGLLKKAWSSRPRPSTFRTLTNSAG